MHIKSYVFSVGVVSGLIFDAHQDGEKLSSRITSVAHTTPFEY